MDQRHGRSPVLDATGSMRVCLETVLSHVELVLSERVGPLTPEQLRFLQTASRQSHRLLRLIEDVQLVAGAEDGDVPEATVCSLSKALARAVQSRVGAGYARETPIELDVRGERRIVGEATTIERAFVALLDVALAEAEPGSTIQVALRERDVVVEYTGGVAQESLGIAVAEAVAKLHGGELRSESTEGAARLTLALAGDVPRRLRAVA
jgi:signal transduction histidine kinase